MVRIGQSSMQTSIWEIVKALLFGVVLICICSGGAFGQEIPSLLQVVGAISTSDSDVVLVEGDEVLVVRADTGAIEASGNVISSDGTYFVQISKIIEFNGTVLSLRLKSSSGTYQLEFGSTNAFSFSGSFPFPSRTVINPTIGEKLSVGDGNAGGVPGSRNDQLPDRGLVNDQFDVNGDGIFSQEDIDLIKEAITAADPLPSADVNGDGIINTRDAIDAIKAFRRGADRRGIPPEVTTGVGAVVMPTGSEQ